MKKLLWLLLLFAFALTACGVLPEQTDAADEAILRVVAMSRAEGDLKITAVTAGIKTGESTEPPETVEGSGSNYAEARADLKSERQASLMHAADWVVEEGVLSDALHAFLTDPELTYDAHIYLLKGQTVQDFLGAFEEEETGPAKALDDLDRALKDRGVTVLRCSALLAAGKECNLPVLEAKDGTVHVVDEVTVQGWK